MKNIFSSLSATAFVVLSSVTPVFAGVLTLEGTSDKKIENVSILPNAHLTTTAGQFSLNSVGSGLRTKKVLMAKVKVYVAQLLVTNANRFSTAPEMALASLDDSDTVVMNLTFLRRVEAEKVRTSFLEALNINKVSLTSSAIADFLKAVETSGDALEGKTFVVAIHKNSDGTEILTFEDSLGKVTTIKGEKGLTNSIFSMWLGIPADDGLATLKEQLLGK